MTLNFQILISFHLEKNDYENTIFIFENQQFNVLRRCFYELSPRAFPEKKKKSFNFQAMAPSKMSAPIRPSMVEKYAQREREVIFREEIYWLDHTLMLDKWYLGTKSMSTTCEKARKREKRMLLI